MRAVLKLELIADDFFWAEKKRKNSFEQWLRYIKKLGPDKSQTWVASVQPDMSRQRVQGTRDYSQANRAGSRGIYSYYALKPGVYEVNHRYKLNRVRRYFILVTGDSYREIDSSEVSQWLKI